jgi:histidinol-phosphate/aromatic aminotransferase/cobyric acid decarboxylase-like protein/choline kinase
MKAIILVAGRGSRLKPLTDKTHKCLTEVNGKSILKNALEILNESRIKEVILVIGYLGEQIKSNVGDGFKNLRIKYVEQDRVGETNNGYALWLATKDIGEDVLIIEGDVFFEKKLLEDFLNSPQKNSTIVEAYNENLDGSFVDLREGFVVDWVHKSKRPQEFKIEDKYKTVNIHKFDEKFFREIFFPYLDRHIKEGKEGEPIECVMQDIVKNYPKEIFAFETKKLKWFEIDDLKDLKIAEKIFKPSLKTLRSFHGGYWKYDINDFHYLVNCHFPTEEIYKKLKDKLPDLIENYPSDKRIIAENLSKWKNKSYFSPDNLIVTNGSSEAIKILNQIIDKITVPIPCFNEYVDLPEDKLNIFQLEENEEFSLKTEEFIKSIKESKSNFAVINNPNNPTGKIVSREDIMKILETGVNLIVDEAFMDFSVENSVEDLTEKYSNLIIVKTVTKTMGLAGLRLGYILTTNEEIKDKIKKLLPIWNINSIAEYFIEIFPEFEEDYWNSIRKTKEERKELFESLKEISYLEPHETKSNFIFCKTKISSKELAEFLYEKHDIILRSELNQKELESDNYIRVAVKTKKENTILLKALKEFEKEG